MSLTSDRSVNTLEEFVPITQPTNREVTNKLNLFINSEPLLHVMAIIYSNLQGASTGKNYSQLNSNKEKLLKINADILFNKICKTNKLIPKNINNKVNCNNQ